MTTIVRARSLTKHYGRFKALDGLDLSIERGAITGLIGPNGAGKTTTLKALLGLCDFDGDLSVAGRDPRSARHKLMEDVCFIADVGILPKWLKVSEAVEYVGAVHPRFDHAKARQTLAAADIGTNRKVKELSKGTVTKLHLALVMAIDVKLLVLDEPTLGLDIVYRKEFYERLLSDYCDGDRTVIISTHQVEEIEALLTQLIFIDRGKIVLDAHMSDVVERFVGVRIKPGAEEQAQELKPVYVRKSFGINSYLFENQPRDVLQRLGELYTPSVSDIFVAKMKQEDRDEFVPD
ncbi:MAG: ABC transporter ATP-binding protein [Pseudohongiellaceae bacterium]